MTPPDAPSQRLIATLHALRVPWERIEPLSGDVSTRRYFRVWSSGTTLIACLYPEPFDEREPARQRWLRLCAADESMRLGFASDPVAFLETTAWLTAVRVPVPRIREVAGASGCIIMDDAGDRSLQSVLPSLDEKQAACLYERAMDYIVRLQRSTDEARRRNLVACALRLDEEKLTHELAFLGRAAAKFCSVLTAGAWDALEREWSMIARAASSPEMVLCHRDYHARNLFLKDDALVVLDHQDLRLGSRHYDVASLLWDPYVALRPGLRDSILEAAGIACDRHMTAVVWQRLLKALGTYLNVLLIRPSGTFVASALRVVGALRTLDPPMSEPLTATGEMLGWVEEQVHARFGIRAVPGQCPDPAYRQGEDNGGDTQESR